jgi:energy-coupling factor transport system ATP-binding protein
MSRLSGGQKRRVALAGVLAMKPEYLILDEPTAGLDPEGRKELLDIIDALHTQVGMTIIMVTHDADSVVKRADRVIAMDKGNIVSDGSPVETFMEMFERKCQQVNYADAGVRANAKSFVNDTYDTGFDMDEKMSGLPIALELIISLSRLGMDIPYYTVDMDECVELIKNVIV